MATGKVSIITREGTTRSQGDTSSWKNTSPSSSSPEGSRSTEDKIRDSINYNVGRPSWATKPADKESIEGTQKFKTVDQIKTQQQSISKKGTLTALKEGYKAGKGEDYSLEGLQNPEIKAQNLKTYGIFEKSQALSSKIDTFQEGILSRLPGQGVGKDIVRGVSNLPEIAVSTAGGIPLGLEHLARNRGSALDSTAFGLGVTAGATVHKARENPGELAGELLGGYIIGKGAGAAGPKIKDTFSIPKLKEFSLSERASLGAGRTQRLDTKNPLRKAAAPKQQLVYKEKPITVQEIKVPTYTYKHGRLYPENQLPKLGGAVDIMKLETKTGGRVSARGRASVRARTQRGSHTEQVQETPEVLKIETIEVQKFKFPEEPKLITDQELTGVQTPKTKAFEMAVLKPQEVGKINEVSVLKPLDVQISKQKSLLSNDLFSLSLPLTAQGLNLDLKPATREKQDISILGVTLPKLKGETVPELKLKQDSIFSPLEVQDQSLSSLPVTLPEYSPISIPKIKPIQDIPGSKTFDPFQIYPARKTKLPILPGDIDLLDNLRGRKRKTKKTKHKTTKNTYGDASILFTIK